ncbi:MAG: hypothetical protein D6701_01940 [Gemmatimonadetes bacterium]|nr:MAG: hypothetical protein D6701_01940 [Gemmatimonadota bacterium]
MKRSLWLVVALAAVLGSPTGSAGAATAAQDLGYDSVSAVHLRLLVGSEAAAGRGRPSARARSALGFAEALVLATPSKSARWSLFFRTVALGGSGPAAWVGDLAGTSGNEAPDGVHVQDLAVEWRARPGVSLLAGLYDLNLEFDVTEAAAGFLHASFGMGAEFAAAGVQGPSTYPYTAPVLRISVSDARGRYLLAAASDAVPGRPGDPSRERWRPGGDGVLFTAEGGRHWSVDPDWMPGRVAVEQVSVGVWASTRADSLTGDPVHPLGGYVILGLRVGAGEAFARIGAAREHGAPLHRSVNVGAAGPLFRRLGPAETWGLGLTWAATSSHWRRMGQGAPAGEAVVEGYLGIPVGARGWLQPTLQWVLNPAAAPERNGALQLTLRAQWVGWLR